MDSRHFPKLKILPRGVCPTCKKVRPDIYYDRTCWKWKRPKVRKYCSEACRQESQARGGLTWLQTFAPKRTLEVLGLPPGDS